MSSGRLLTRLASVTRPAAAAARPLASRRGLSSTPPNRIVHEIKRDDEFRQVVSDNARVVVDCFADWCAPCKAIAPILAQHSEEARFKDKVVFVKLDVDALPAVAQAMGVRAMPTFLFFQDGKKVDTLVGSDTAALAEALCKLAKA